MERKRQRDIAMGAAALAIVAIAGLRISSSLSAPDATESQPAATASSRQTPGLTPEITALNLDALRAERPQPVDSTRNPFGFKPKPSPPPPSAVVRPAVPVPPMGPVEAPPPPPPPRIPLKFIGQLETGKTGLMAILSDGRGTPFYGKQGDIVDGRYRILRIGVESIDLAYLDGRGRQTIRFTGQ